MEHEYCVIGNNVSCDFTHVYVFLPSKEASSLIQNSFALGRRHYLFLLVSGLCYCMVCSTSRRWRK